MLNPRTFYGNARVCIFQLYTVKQNYDYSCTFCCNLASTVAVKLNSSSKSSKNRIIFVTSPMQQITTKIYSELRKFTVLLKTSVCKFYNCVGRWGVRPFLFQNI